MTSKQVTDTFPQRKRVAHQPRGVQKPGTSKASPQDVTKENLKILKQFDLTLEYGPCIGITRLERWERADKHGLNPPMAVRDIIIKHRSDEAYTERKKSQIYNNLKGVYVAPGSGNTRRFPATDAQSREREI